MPAAFHPFGFPLPDLTSLDKLRLEYSRHNTSVRNKNTMLTTMLITKLLACKLCQEKEIALDWGSLAWTILTMINHPTESSLSINNSVRTKTTTSGTD